jgi:hypothetical protein
MTQTKEINGRTFKVEKFHAVKAFKLKVKIAKIIMEPLAALIEKGDLSGNTDLLEQELNFSNAIRSLFENIEDENVLMSLVIEILCKTRLINGPSDEVQIENEPGFNMVFKDGLKDLYELIAFVITVNYSDLLEVVGGNIGNLKSMLNQTPSSPSPVI